MFGSQESRVNRSQDLKREKEGTFKNLGLAATQCNGIAACAYSLKKLQYIHYCTLSVILRPLLSFVLINGPK